LLLLVGAQPARATEPNKLRANPQRFAFPNPAGPTPLNAAGPTPLHAAGPTPLNPAGPPPLFPTGRFRGGPVVTTSDPLFRPQPFVSVIEDHGVQQALAGSFFCQLHNRGFATQGLFFDHLLAADGIDSAQASEALIEDGGVWIFPAE
jgi:hypothetical protein